MNDFLSWAIPEKKGNRGVEVRTHFFENPRGIFRFFTLPLEIPDKARPLGYFMA